MEAEKTSCTDPAFDNAAIKAILNISISSCSQSVTAFLAEKRKQFAGTVAFKVTDILARNQNRHKIICLIGHYLNLLDKTFFHQVEYINNRSKLYPNLLLKNNNRILMVPNQLGLNKY